MKKKNFRDGKEMGGNQNPQKKQHYQKKNVNFPKRSGSKPKDKEYGSERADKGYSNENDVSWYVTDDQMLRDVASVPFSYAAGKRYTHGGAEISDTWVGGEVINPGSCVCYVRPALPKTTVSSDPVNQAGWKIVSFLKHTISASLPYEGPDVMVLLIGMANLYAYLNFCSRAYAVTGLYSNLNRYYNDSILASMGIDPVDLKNNLSMFRKGINQIIRQAATLSIPSNLKYFKRTAFMYSNIYIGGTAIQDQLYYYSPAGFWKYTETDYEGAGLKYVPFIDDTSSSEEITLKKAADLIKYGRDLLNGIMSSDDVVMISANILRAYGTAGTLKLELLPDEAQIQPTFDIGVLEQIANAEVIWTSYVKGVDASDDGWNLKQHVSHSEAVSMLKWNPKIDIPVGSGNRSYAQSAVLYGSMRHIVNTATQYTSPELVIESTRLKFNVIVNKTGSPEEYDVNVYENSASYEIEFDFPTEVITRVIMLFGVRDNASGLNATVLSDFSGYLVMPSIINHLQSNGPKIGEYLAKYLLMNSFKFKPQLFINMYNGSNFNDRVTVDVGTAGSSMLVNMTYYPAFDLDNFAFLDKQALAAINEAATFSMFNIDVVSNAYRG